MNTYTVPCTHYKTCPGIRKSHCGSRSTGLIRAGSQKTHFVLGRGRDFVWSPDYILSLKQRRWCDTTSVRNDWSRSFVLFRGEETGSHTLHTTWFDPHPQISSLWVPVWVSVIHHESLGSCLSTVQLSDWAIFSTTSTGGRLYVRQITPEQPLVIRSQCVLAVFTPVPKAVRLWSDHPRNV